MKVLFITSEHPERLFGGLGTFTREYVKELRKYAEVKCVYIHLRDEPCPKPNETVDMVICPYGTFEAFSPEAQILEAAASLRAQLEPLLKEFNPDVIHCNDRQTYLPFRFDKNVFYSSHLIYTDLIASSALNDLYFQEIKVERCALTNSAVLAVYSDFAAKSAYKLAGGQCSPIVLPLGLRTDKFIQKTKKISPQNKKGLTVSYFGRFENVQKGINDFIYAVNILGKSFKNKFNLTYNLYGSGVVDSYMDTSLFDHIDFLQGNDLIKAYKEADIVVMPSRYEPFGFTGLEAMAAGNLLLVTEGLGMDMYAEPGVNCLSIPHDPFGISTILREAIIDYDKMTFIRDNAIKTAEEWTWKRCVQAHLDVYKQLCQERVPQLSSAYRMEQREILSSYNKISQVKKLYCSTQEQKACDEILKNYEKWDSDAKILVLTGNYIPQEKEYSKNVTFVSTLMQNSHGIVTRLECLPFEENEFDIVIAAGAWETVLDPCGAISEMERVSKQNVIILYHKGKPHEWQTIQMETEKDWLNFNRTDWKYTPENKNFLINSVEIEKNTSYGAVVYNRLLNCTKESIEITA